MKTIKQAVTRFFFFKVHLHTKKPKKFTLLLGDISLQRVYLYTATRGGTQSPLKNIYPSS